MKELSVKRAATQCQKCAKCMRSGPEICPMYEEYKSQALSPPGIFLMADVVLEGVMKPSVEISVTPFACTMCGACSINCWEQHLHWMHDYPTQLIEGIREVFVERGTVPEEINEVFRNMYNTKNAWGLPNNQRVDWEKKSDISIPDYSKEKNEFLLFIGDTPLIPETQHLPSIVAKLLQIGGVDFGTLKEKEMDSGNEIREMGESGLFEVIAQENIEIFKQYGVNKLITISPHDYHTFCYDYPKLGLQFEEVYHYTQIIEELIKQEKIKPVKSISKSVTFQDPCHLGRYNNIYETPRNILSAIPGVKLVEMSRSFDKAFCCGGGGGRTWYDDPAMNKKQRISDIRARHAKDVGAELIATACPYCLNMLKAAGNLEKTVVKDVAELVLESIGS